MWTLVMWTATFRPHILLVFIRQWGRLVTCHLLSRMLCCDWCILILTVVVCCSLSSPLSYDSCVVVFLDRLMKTSSMQLKHRHPHHKWPHCETNENTDYSCTPPQWITTTVFTTLKGKKWVNVMSHWQWRWVELKHTVKSSELALCLFVLNNAVLCTLLSYFLSARSFISSFANFVFVLILLTRARLGYLPW